MRHPCLRLYLLLPILLSLTVSATTQAADDPLPTTVSFNRDIRPILSNLCYHCHGPDKTKREADLRFDTRAGLFAKKTDHHVVVPGKPASSELYRRITTGEADQRMPPADSGLSLTPRQASLIQKWIAQGATWQPHWSFIPPTRPRQPKVSRPEWPRNAIDNFILARLDREKMSPSPETDRTTLLRRLHLDLTGLPPTPHRILAFLADTRPGAYQREVDRLLASPRAGEHLAVNWLDAARYADTSGYQNDGPRSMWRWRDWVLDAFNHNKPFDEFTVEQLAGDLLPKPTLDQLIATGFNRNHRGNSEGGVIPEEFQVEYVVDRVDTTATVWLGLTMKCARCHEHKYDPIPQQEFYRVFAYFNNIPENGRAIKEGNSPPYIKAPTPAQLHRQQQLATTISEATRTALKLQPLLGMAQRKWESTKGAAVPATTDWSITDGLAAHFPLDGTLTNTVNAKQPALPLPAEADYANGQIGKAVRLKNGEHLATDKTVAPFGYRDTLSLSTWLNASRVDRGTLISKMADQDRGKGYYVDLASGHIRINLIARWLDDSIRVRSAKPILANRWYHVVVTYDGSRLASGIQLYLDGVPTPLVVDADFINQSFAADEPVRIGGGGGPDGRFTGLLDDIRIYSRDLTATEVSILAVPDNIPSILKVSPNKRTPGQAAKLRDYFIARHASPAHRNTVNRLVALHREARAFNDSIPTVMVMQDLPEPRKTHVLVRGQYDRPGVAVQPGTPESLPKLTADSPPNRLGLARWLVNKKNPLTARVITNRLWQGLLGIGLVRTTEDFGSQGELPSHPELLDWLATEFHHNDWDMKGIIRLIVTSSTYRQSSRVTPAQLERDPKNRLLARAPRYRLSAEVIRDQALFASGLLNERIGGPSVRPYQPEGLWKEIASTTNYDQSTGGDLHRRSLYTYSKRTVTNPTMLAFDASTREACMVRPSRTNTPLQALTLMNDVTFTESARVLAERVLSSSLAGDVARLERVFLLTISRQPTTAESSILLANLKHQRSAFTRAPEAAAKLAATGDTPRQPGLDDSEVATWTTLSSLLLNLDEAISRE
ncbi:DUF1553 domain-containing protein [Planctomycetaceae bacterium]|nr:DUF1553 domain-containing protein [Planctomycetaceae bacterium]